MYWALTGKNIPTLIPIKKESVTRLEKKDCLTPHELKKQIPIELSNLVMSCVKDDPADRPRNMMDIITSLDMMIHDIFGDRIKGKKDATNND